MAKVRGKIREPVRGNSATTIRDMPREKSLVKTMPKFKGKLMASNSAASRAIGPPVSGREVPMESSGPKIAMPKCKAKNREPKMAWNGPRPMASQQGGPIGEQRAIEQYEGKSLQTATLNGEFAGTFASQVPNYPGVESPSLGQCSGFFREIVRMACLDGLEYGYYQEAEAAYHRNIGNVYNRAYNQAYGSAYQKAIGVYYKESFATGQQAGIREKFDQIYPEIKESFRVKTKQKFSTSPERKSSDYRKAFTGASQESYQQKYEEIRSKTFAKATKQTYRDNIDDQITRFTKLRFEQVAGIYQNYPVLRYERSENSDAGIRGVAANDGIYQPEERIAHHITISNYGHSKARGVVVHSSSGEKTTLPDLPARSTVTVKGAAVSKVEAAVGGTGESKIVLRKKLNSLEPAIEGRHFYNGASGQINAQDVESFSVQYPLAVASIAVEGDLLLGREASYRVVVENRSKRPYFGPIEVRLDTSLGQGVLTSALADITHLESQQTLEQGRLLVDRESDALAELTFDASLVKNGVVLGQVQNAGSKLVQIHYQDKGDALVIMGDAKQDAKTLLDALAEWGGIEQLSVLDVALDQDALLKSGELARKTVLLAQREIGSKMRAALEQMIRSNTGLVMLSDPDLDHELATLPSMNLSVRPNLADRGTSRGL